MTVSFRVNGQQVAADDETANLLDVLRDELGFDSVKDGCSPQGQCGCCTVWIDGQARVACVTPVRRLVGREVTTVEGLDPAVSAEWGERFCSLGASQCGFCTTGIVMRLEAARRARGVLDEAGAHRALSAHLCRCTGWRSIVEAAVEVNPSKLVGRRSLSDASQRASIETGSTQVVDPSVALGWSGFGDDGAPRDSLIAVSTGGRMGGPFDPDQWVVAETMNEARRRSAKVQGRNSTVDSTPPLAVPDGEWDLTLATSWVEPAYLETDAAWCVPGGVPSNPLANGGAFGGKLRSSVGEAARALADLHGRPVRVRWSREDSVRNGPKRPPLSAGLRRDGTGLVRVAATEGIAERIASYLPDAAVEEVELLGPPTASDIRGAGWVEAAVLAAELAGHPGEIVAPNGSTATATIAADGSIDVTVSCGPPLDETVLVSYCVGAAHMALGWVTSEGLAVAPDGAVFDLTIRSFGILGPARMPRVRVLVQPDDDAPRCGSDAVFAAVASAVWHGVGCPAAWPTGHGGRA